MHQVGYDPKLASVLRNACMKDKTVIITTLNDAWAEPGSIFDLFLESFHLGNQTKMFLNHLVVITWDQKAHARCLALHKHCYQVETKGDKFTGEAFFFLGALRLPRLGEGPVTAHNHIHTSQITFINMRKSSWMLVLKGTRTSTNHTK